jgi:WD40 repeat protein
VLSASWDGTLKLWEVASGRELHSFEGHSWEVVNEVFSPDGRLLLSASDGGMLKLWEVASGRELHSFEGHTREVMSTAFSLDGKMVLSASDSGTLKLWEVDSGRLLRCFEDHTSGVSSAVFSPDGRTVLSGSYNGTLKLWEVEEQARRKGPASLRVLWLALRSGRWSRFVVEEPLRSHSEEDGINDCAFSADGAYAVFVTWGGVLRLWDVAGWRPLATFRTDEALMCCAIAPDKRTIVAGGQRGQLYWLRVVWEG